MKQHVYQFALRRADNKKKQFIIERELIYSKDKLNEDQMKAISDEHKCDIHLIYLGVLTPSKKEEIMNIEYHTKDMIQLKLDLWHEPQEKEQANGWYNFKRYSL